MGMTINPLPDIPAIAYRANTLRQARCQFLMALHSRLLTNGRSGSETMDESIEGEFKLAAKGTRGRIVVASEATHIRGSLHVFYARSAEALNARLSLPASAKPFP